MPGRVIANLQAPTAYSTASTIRWSSIIRVFLDVQFYPIYYQLTVPIEGVSESSWEWGIETPLNPGQYSLTRRTSGIRFRRQIAADLPTVSVEVLTPLEIAGGFPTPPEA